MDFYSGYSSDDTLSSVLNGTKVFTDLSQLASQLGKIGVDGPRHFREPNLTARGHMIGYGAQFEVFEDRFGALQDIVIKRVRLNTPAGSAPPNARSHLRTLELEIASLCDPIRRLNRNIVDLISWGYDYPSSDISLRLPVLCMEKALCTLGAFLQRDDHEAGNAAIKYQLCLDVASGLHGIHLTGLVHGDLKPANVLVFSQIDEYVPFIAKLSDFGKCIEVNEQVRSFALYAGTRDWTPPEVAASFSGPPYSFQSSLLFKCDSYAYGLLAVSVLAFKGGIVQNQEEIGTDVFLNKTRDRSSDLPDYAKTCLEKVVSHFLRHRPEDRLNVSPDILECDNKCFTDWLQARQKPLVRQVGRKNADLFTGYAYYSVLDLSTLAQLEAQFSDSASASELFTNDILFGMAIRVLVLTGNQHRERAARYLQAAAKRSNLPAKAISKRIRDAVKSNENSVVPDVDINQWLFEGASRGSLIAMEDLRQENPGLAQVARHEFSRIGGFNENVSPTVRDHVIYLSQDLDLAYDCNKAIDAYGNRPLHYAASYGLAPLIEQFVNSGASINQRNHQGETALYKACLAADVQCVKVLVKLGADASLVTSPFGISCLHWLFNFDEVGIKDIAHLLVLRGASVGALTQHVKDAKMIRQIPSEHFPFYWPQGAPIHWACFARSPTAIDALLENGASVDDLDAVEDVHAQTALSMATYRGDSLMVKHLLSKGANPNRLDGTGCSPAHMMAISSTRKNRLLDMPNALRWWVYHGSWQNHIEELTKCAQALADRGGNLNAQTRSRGSNDNLSSPILDAVEDKNAGVVLALLNAGASADCAIPFSGESPFHVWAGVGSHNLPYAGEFSAVCAMLLRSMRDLNVRDSNGKSILHGAVTCPSEDDFRYLTDLLARPESLVSLEVKDCDSSTPLLQAVQMMSSSGAQHDAVLRANLLLDIGADITARDYDNRDFLYLACQNRELSDSQCLQLIKKAFQGLPLESKKDLAKKSVSRKKGNTALMCACNNFFLQVVNFLLECGIDVNVVSKAGSTALDFVLDSSQWTRQRYLNDWVVHRHLLFEYQKFSFNGLDVQADALISPVALLDSAQATAELFQRTLTESDLSSRGARNGYYEAHKYFACIDVVKTLQSVGALPAKMLIPEPEEYDTFDPAQWDAEWVEEMRGEVDGFLAEMQPFYEKHWKLLYALRPGSGPARYPENGFALRALDP